VEGDAAALAGLIAASARAVMNEAADEAALRAGMRRLAAVIAASVRAS
jgi:hypothetical protein